jgi:pyrimidine operon attenuation protein/uracil phosphoribosyltransferase
MGETEKILLRSEEVQRTTSRMAHEIVEKGGSVGQIALIGIRTRGGHLVRRIAQKMESFCGTTPLVGIIDVTSYRDDLGRKERGGVPIPDEIPSSLDEKTVVLVDDVIYTGRTVRAALEMTSRWGKPGKIMVAVLVDRGDRELPIKADIVGKNVQASASERVNVYLEESDGIDQVTVSGNPRGPIPPPTHS